MVRTGVKSDSLIAATISASTWLNEGQDDLIGTQSDESMSQYTRYYAVDTSKFDLSDITSDLRRAHRHREDASTWNSPTN